MSTTKPILRIFDERKAREFYLDFLGFTVNWEHRFDDKAPIYMEVALGDVVLHLSEHHGDGTPGTRVFIDDYKNLRAFQEGLIAKQYKYNRPGIQVPFYDDSALEMTADDPFMNKLVFVERGVVQ
ncbi:MAG: VOC family protein [Chitinophagaceae bacterium]|nr:MAG: VOC family protein [Chitinophagaceae bacterium]